MTEPQEDRPTIEKMRRNVTLMSSGGMEETRASERRRGNERKRRAQKYKRIQTF